MNRTQLYFLGGGYIGPPRDCSKIHTGLPPWYPTKGTLSNYLFVLASCLTFSTSGGCGNSAVRCVPAPHAFPHHQHHCSHLLFCVFAQRFSSLAHSCRRPTMLLSPLVLLRLAHRPPLLLMDCLQPCSSANCSPRTKH